jgi:hypothetical protein
MQHKTNVLYRTNYDVRNSKNTVKMMEKKRDLEK